MKKIPTLFERVFENHKVVAITDKVTPGMEWVLEGKGDATIKFDGSCCAIIDNELYKRFDAKKGKKPPVGAIPCCDPDWITGHWPHWVKCDRDNPVDKWFFAAYENSHLFLNPTRDVYTCEAVGRHFNGNPYQLDYDKLIPHGKAIVKPTRSFSGIRDYLEVVNIEGLVFWLNDEPMCKIKRTDFGFEWPVNNTR